MDEILGKLSVSERHRLSETLKSRNKAGTCVCNKQLLLPQKNPPSAKAEKRTLKADFSNIFIDHIHRLLDMLSKHLKLEFKLLKHKNQMKKIKLYL